MADHLVDHPGTKRAAEDAGDDAKSEVKKRRILRDSGANIKNTVVGGSSEGDVIHEVESGIEVESESSIEQEIDGYDEHRIPRDLLPTVQVEAFLPNLESKYKTWLQQIVVKCFCKEKQIGKAIGWRIDRSSIRPIFYESMKEPCHGMSQLAFDLFDRYGFLKQEFQNHPVRKGTGAWGEELGYAMILFIEYISLNRKSRRQGFARLMVDALIKKAETHPRGLDISLIMPSLLGNMEFKAENWGKSEQELLQIRSRHLDGAVAFCRKLGFRRIGASCWFGLSTDPSHKGHKISPSDDYNPPTEDKEDDSLHEGIDINDYSFEDKLEQKRMDIMEEQQPLIHAAVTLPDEECVGFFEGFLRGGYELYIERGGWGQADRAGDNILHILAKLTKPKSIQWVIKKIDRNGILRIARNIKGYTPIESLQSILEDRRTRTECGMLTICKSDGFDGFNKSAIASLLNLQGVQNIAAAQDLCLKYGCTCGECLGGILSPRMKFALLCEAEEMQRELYEYINNGLPFVGAQYLRRCVIYPDIKAQFEANKWLQEAYRALFDSVVKCLRDNLFPNPINILRGWEIPPQWLAGLGNFLERVGFVKSALNKVFNAAWEHDEKAGDTRHFIICEEKIMELPECRNDHEFGFVALHCGFGFRPHYTHT